MAEFYNLIRNAIAELPQNTGTARRAVYERARVALVDQLRAVQPPLSPGEITKHRLSLEDCIRRVEQEASDLALGVRSQAAAQQVVGPNFGRLPAGGGYQVPQPLHDVSSQRAHAGFSPNFQAGMVPEQNSSELQFDFRGGPTPPSSASSQDSAQGFSAPFPSSGHAKPLENNGQAQDSGEFDGGQMLAGSGSNGEMSKPDLQFDSGATSGQSSAQFASQGSLTPPNMGSAPFAHLPGDLGAGMGQVVRAAEEAARRGTANFFHLSTEPGDAGHASVNGRNSFTQLPPGKSGFGGDKPQEQITNSASQGQLGTDPASGASGNDANDGWSNPPMEDPQDVIDRAINTLNREAQSAKNASEASRDTAKAIDSLNNAFNSSFSNLKDMENAVVQQTYSGDSEIEDKSDQKAAADEKSVKEGALQKTDPETGEHMSAPTHTLTSPDSGGVAHQQAQTHSNSSQVQTKHMDVVNMRGDSELGDNVVFDDVTRSSSSMLRPVGGGGFSALGEQISPGAADENIDVPVMLEPPSYHTQTPQDVPEVRVGTPYQFDALADTSVHGAPLNAGSTQSDVDHMWGFDASDQNYGHHEYGGQNFGNEYYNALDYEPAKKRSKLSLMIAGSFVLLLLSVGLIFTLWPETYRLAVATISGVVNQRAQDSAIATLPGSSVVPPDRTVETSDPDQSNDGQRDVPLSSQVSALTESERLLPNDMTSAPTVASSIRAQSLLLEQAVAPDEAVPPFNGNVNWSQEQDANGLPVIVGSAKIPARNISMRIEIRKNADPSLPASHVMEVQFDVSPGFVGGGVATMPGIVLKQQKFSNGTPLVGAHARVRDNQFLFALSSSDADIRRNIDLLADLQWMDVPIVYNTGQRAIFSLEKGEEGAELFLKTFANWGDR